MGRGMGTLRPYFGVTWAAPAVRRAKPGPRERRLERSLLWPTCRRRQSDSERWGGGRWWVAPPLGSACSSRPSVLPISVFSRLASGSALASRVREAPGAFCTGRGCGRSDALPSFSPPKLFAPFDSSRPAPPSFPPKKGSGGGGGSALPPRRVQELR